MITYILRYHNVNVDKNKPLDVNIASNKPPGSLGSDHTLCGDEDNTLLELSGEAVSDDTYAQEGYVIDSVEAELHLQGTSQIDRKGESSDCDWDGIIPNCANIFVEAEAGKGLMQNVTPRFPNNVNNTNN